MQPVDQEKAETVTASAEDTVEQATQEGAAPDEPKMEVTQAESAQSEQLQPEPAQEMETEQQESPEENPMEVVDVDPWDPGGQQETVPAESAAQESVESESERIARIVKEEIAQAESAQATTWSSNCPDGADILIVPESLLL